MKMSAENSGCYYGAVENGQVFLQYCQQHNSRVYCRYYCDDGYKRTASTAYCAGNNKWMIDNFPYSKLCVPSTDTNSCSNNRFVDNGWVESLPCEKDCVYYCFDGYKRTTHTVFCSEDGKWVPTGYAPSDHVQPCVEITGEQSSPTPPPFATTVSPFPQQTTQYRGYYSDPGMSINVSPVVFVGAVIGGIVFLVILAFAVFFRAHRKNLRYARASRFAEQLSQQNLFVGGPDFSNFPDATDYNDSEFRDIARRIVARANPVTVPNNEGGNKDESPAVGNGSNNNPPPYEAISSPLNAHGQRRQGSDQEQPPLYEQPNKTDEVSHVYQALHVSPVNKAMHIPPSAPPAQDNTAAFVGDDENTETMPSEEPPPYEIQRNESNVQSKTSEPPPPYSEC